MSSDPFLLVARIDGRSASRRSRGFKTRQALDKARQRWSNKDGYTTFWVYGAAAGIGKARTLLESPGEGRVN